MAFGFSTSRVSPIAIDFGADSIKMLQVVLGEPPQIIAAGSADVPEHVRTDPAARHAFYVEAIKMMLKSQPFKGKRAVCSIPAYQSLVQHLQIAKVEHEDLDEQIAIYLRQRLNVDPSRMVIRSAQVGQIVREGSSKQEVICFAISRDVVMRQIETAHRAKLEVVDLHCEPHALIKSFAHLYRRTDDDQRTTCFIDIGAATTKVLIAHGTQLVFAQNIHAAGDHLTRAVAKSQSLSFAEARKRRIAEAKNVRPPTEAVKTPVPAMAASDRRGGGTPTGVAAIDAQFQAELGDPHTGGVATIASLGNPKQSQVSDGQGDMIECLVDELQLAVRYHQTMFPGRPIEKLVFLGGESNHVATCQKIAKTLRIGAQLGDPLARACQQGNPITGMGVDLRDPQPGWAVPFGLCLLETSK